jgi:ectoine hydroxylase-related dioxygenase (phytanoyl-CoA dioxygenase family)
MKKYLCNKKDRLFYERNGYFVARSVLSPKECSVLIKEAHKICEIETVTSNIYRKSKKYLNLLKDKRILSLADSLLQWRVIPIGDIFFFSKSKNKKEGGSVPHQDNYAQRAEYGAYMAVGVYLDDAVEDNGALRVYPGSHKLGEVKSNPKPNWIYNKKGKIIAANAIGNNCVIPKKFINKEKIVELGKGDILFFHAHLIHYAKKNMSEVRKYRRAIYLKYIKNGYAFWPGWTERRELIDRDDFNKNLIK